MSNIGGVPLHKLIYFAPTILQKVAQGLVIPAIQSQLIKQRPVRGGSGNTFNKYATGDTYNSFYWVYSQERKQAYISIFTRQRQLYWAMYGRGAGGIPPRAELIRWIKSKPQFDNLSETQIKQVAYVLAKRIAAKGTRKGYQTPNLINETVKYLKPQIENVFTTLSQKKLIEALKAIRNSAQAEYTKKQR